jgi:uncharacterized protein (TIGR02001 family)
MEKTMKLKSKLLLALLAASAGSFAYAEEAADPLAFNVGVVSEYRYRGIGQTKGDPALQGGVDYTAANGFYAGAWGSTIKWIKDTGGSKGSTELDLYGGYKFEAAGLAYDVGFLRYEYAKNDYSPNANTNEVYGAATYGVTTLKYSHSLSNLFGNANSKNSTYLDLSATFDVGNGYSLVPHVGHQKVKSWADLSYTDYALTLNKDLGEGLSASVSAITISGGKGIAALSTTGYDAAKNTVVVGVKYTF